MANISEGVRELALKRVERMEKAAGQYLPSNFWRRTIAAEFAALLATLEAPAAPAEGEKRCVSEGCENAPIPSLHLCEKHYYRAAPAPESQRVRELREMVLTAIDAHIPQEGDSPFAELYQQVANIFSVEGASAGSEAAQIAAIREHFADVEQENKELREKLAEAVRKGVAAGLEEAARHYPSSERSRKTGAWQYICTCGWEGPDWRLHIRDLDPEAIARRVSEGREKGK